MLLVVESGSTKADWMLISSEGQQHYSTKGFNPYFSDSDDILNELHHHNELSSIKTKVTKIYFYGAGCSTIHRNAIVKNALQAFFIAATISVDHDLKASVLSLYNDQPVIACILGTGSNACFYDGIKLHKKSQSLGYILGDEASGSYFGKKIIADFLYGRLPSKMMQDMSDYGYSKDQFLDHIYSKEQANVFIASFMPVLVNNKGLDYSQQLIRTGISEFLERHVLCYPEAYTAEVSFVGSVAHFLKDELTIICVEKGISIGKVIRRPLEHLVQYHISTEKI